MTAPRLKHFNKGINSLRGIKKQVEMHLWWCNRFLTCFEEGVVPKCKAAKWVEVHPAWNCASDLRWQYRAPRATADYNNPLASSFQLVASAMGNMVPGRWCVAIETCDFWSHSRANQCICRQIFKMQHSAKISCWKFSWNNLKTGPNRRRCTMMRKPHQHFENPGLDENMRLAAW